MPYGAAPHDGPGDPAVSEPETVRRIMGILESSETLRLAEERRRNPVYALAQLFAVNVIRDAGGDPYSRVDDVLTDPLCEAVRLPRRDDGTYRRPSVGRLNRFVLEDWPVCSDGFGYEFAVRTIEMRLDRDGPAVVAIDSVILRAGGSYRDKAHIAAIDGIPLFGIRTAATRNDCAEAGDLCRRLRSTGRLWGRDAEFEMDAGYCTSACLAEAFLTTGSRPRVALRSDSRLRPEAEWDRVQSRYCRMYRLPGYDPYRKDDERYVLRFLCANGERELVGKYLLNCEIRRRGGDPRPEAAAAGIRGARLYGGDPSDIRGVGRDNRGRVAAFRFNAVQILSAISVGRCYRISGIHPDVPFGPERGPRFDPVTPSGIRPGQYLYRADPMVGSFGDAVRTASNVRGKGSPV